GAVADQLPDVSFAIVGPAQLDVSELRRHPNIHLFGQRSHAEVPGYVKGFDVGIVPYLRSEFSLHVYPTKLNEYLAMGIPVVATALPEITRFNAEYDGVIADVPHEPGAFAAAVRAAIGDMTPGRVD